MTTKYRQLRRVLMAEELEMARKEVANRRLESWFDELHELSALLTDNTKRCLREALKEGMEDGEEQFWRRMFTRALFAQIEG